MGQGVTDGIAERAQAERVQEHRHLVADANGAVLKVPVIKAEARVDEDFLYAAFFGDSDLPAKIFFHQFGWIGGEIEVADFADVCTLDVTNNGSGVVGGDHPINFVRIARTGEVDNIRSQFKRGAGDFRL